MRFSIGLAFLAGAAGALLAACNGEFASNSTPEVDRVAMPGPDGRPALRFEPTDLTTAVGGLPLQILVGAGGQRVGEALLQEIAREVRLKTWPEMVDVAITANVADTLGAQVDENAHVFVSPEGPLADRWYVLQMKRVPDVAVAPRRPVVHVAPDGSLVSRFRVGSEPLFKSARLAEGKNTLYVEFSETLASDLPSLNAVINVGGAPGRSPVGCGVFWNGVGSGSVIRLRCEAGLDHFPDEIQIGPGLRSLSGRPVAPQRIRIDDSKVDSCGTACLRFLP